jgi:hypothetical protein
MNNEKIDRIIFYLLLVILFLNLLFLSEIYFTYRYLTLLISFTLTFLYLINCLQQKVPTIGGWRNPFYYVTSNSQQHYSIGSAGRDGIGPDWALTPNDDSLINDDIIFFHGQFTCAPASMEGKTDSRSVESLINYLKDRDYRPQKNAAEELGKIKDQRAVEPLINALKDKDSDVREAAVALKEITDQNFSEDHNAWFKWWQKNKSKYQQK